MLPRIAAAGLFFLAGPAMAQSGSCIDNKLLRVDSAFSRHGAGGTFDYSVQVTNISSRTVTFRVTFRMSNSQPDPANRTAAYTIPPNGNRIVPLGNGTEISTTSRIGGGVQLSC